MLPIVHSFVCYFRLATLIWILSSVYSLPIDSLHKFSNNDWCLLNLCYIVSHLLTCVYNCLVDHIERCNHWWCGWPIVSHLLTCVSNCLVDRIERCNHWWCGWLIMQRKQKPYFDFILENRTRSAYCLTILTKWI